MKLVDLWFLHFCPFYYSVNCTKFTLFIPNSHTPIYIAHTFFGYKSLKVQLKTLNLKLNRNLCKLKLTL